jgi:hypothetical protein
LTLSDEDILKLYSIPSMAHLMEIHGLSSQNPIHLEHLHGIIQGMRGDAAGRWQQARREEEAHLQRHEADGEGVKVAAHTMSMNQPLTHSPSKRRTATVEDASEVDDVHGADRAQPAAVMNEQGVARVFADMMSAGEKMRQANVNSQQTMLVMMRDKQEREVEWAEWEEMLKCKEGQDWQRAELEGRERKAGRKKRA